MDEDLLRAVSAKFGEVEGRGDAVLFLLERMGGPAPDRGSFLAGARAGMMLNSFHYQCRRINGRDPTGAEMEEFARLIAGHEMFGG